METPIPNRSAAPPPRMADLPPDHPSVMFNSWVSANELGAGQARRKMVSEFTDGLLNGLTLKFRDMATRPKDTVAPMAELHLRVATINANNNSDLPEEDRKVWSEVTELRARMRAMRAAQLDAEGDDGRRGMRQAIRPGANSGFYRD